MGLPPMPDLTDTALREMYAALMTLKDEVVQMLVAKDKLDGLDIQRVRRMLDNVRGDLIADEMEEVLSRYSRWAYERGIEMIDEAIGGASAAAVLRVPPTTVDVARQHDVSVIRTIAPELLDKVKAELALSFLGSRTPGQIAQRISRRFDVSLTRAEVITRTEGKKLQNFGAEARIRDVAVKARELDIPMVKYWIHSSGSKAKAAKAVVGARGRGGFAKGKARQGYEPRPHHKAMHGVTVAPDEKFVLVNPMTMGRWEIDGPHDPILPAGEVVNCYCERSIRLERPK